MVAASGEVLKWTLSQYEDNQGLRSTFVGRVDHQITNEANENNPEGSFAMALQDGGDILKVKLDKKDVRAIQLVPGTRIRAVLRAKAWSFQGRAGTTYYLESFDLIELVPDGANNAAKK